MSHRLKQLLYLYKTGSLTTELLFNRFLDLAKDEGFESFVGEIPVDLLKDFQAWIHRFGNSDNVINVGSGKIEAREKQLIQEIQQRFRGRV